MKTMLRLSMPVALMYLGLMLMGFVDLLTVGRLGANEVGGLGVGNSIFSWIMVIGVGMLTGMDYPASHAIGDKKPERAYRTYVQTLYLCVAMGIPLTLFLVAVSHNLHLFGFNPDVLPFATQYLSITSVSLIFLFGFNACRGYLQAQGITMPMLWVLILGNIFNLIMNMGLVFGKFGMPEMGFVGSAWATVWARAFTFIFSLLAVIYYDRRTGNYLRTLGLKFELLYLKPILHLGTPASIHMLFEVGVFSLATALSAHFSAQALAAHQIVLTTASMTFMVTLGIASATGVLVGQSMGAKDYEKARRTGWQGIALGAGFMIMSAAVLLILPDTILRLYTPDTEVIGIAKDLLLLAAFFQLADGIQAVVTGALRGIGNTKTAAVTNLVGHWFVGLPVGLWFGFSQGYGVRGIWFGLTTGLVVVATSLLLAWRKRSRNLGPVLAALILGLGLQVFSVSVAQAETVNPDCRFQNLPTVITQNRGSTYLRFDEADRAVFSEPSRPNSPAYEEYLGYVSKNTSLDARGVLERNQEILKNALQKTTDLKFSEYLKSSIDGGRLILDGKVGNLDSIRCLEALLFDEYQRVYPISEVRGEFAAHILKKDTQLRIYLEFRRPVPNFIYSQVSMTETLADIKDGWTWVTHLHNHPFNFSNVTGDYGPLQPSSSDLSFYRLYESQLQEVVITDGRESFRAAVPGLKDLK